MLVSEINGNLGTVNPIHNFPGNPLMFTAGLVGRDTDAELTPTGFVKLTDLFENILIKDTVFYQFGITHARRREEFELDQKNYVGSEIKTEKESRLAFTLKLFPIPADRTPAWGGIYKNNDTVSKESGISLYGRLMDTIQSDYLYLFGDNMVTYFNNIHPEYALAVELMSEPQTEILEEDAFYKQGSRVITLELKAKYWTDQFFLAE